MANRSVSRRWPQLHDAMLIHGGLNDLKARPCWQPFLRLVDATARQRGFGDALGHSLGSEGAGRGRPGAGDQALGRGGNQNSYHRSGRTVLRLCRHAVYLHRGCGDLKRTAARRGRANCCKGEGPARALVSMLAPVRLKYRRRSPRWCPEFYPQTPAGGRRGHYAPFGPGRQIPRACG